MGKSPRRLFGPKHCGGKQAARVGWAPSRTLSKPPSEVQRTSAGWTLGLQGGVVGGCENEERARRSMRGSQLAGKDEMADEKKPATSTATWLTPSRTNLWASHVPRRPRRSRPVVEYHHIGISLSGDGVAQHHSLALAFSQEPSYCRRTRC